MQGVRGDTSRRDPRLDGIRGLAITLVLVGHAFPRALPEAAASGVGIFFVLSGFLITGVLMDEHASSDRVSLRRFYARRGLRLLPAYLCLLSINLAWMLIHDRGSVVAQDIRSIWLSALYVSNVSISLGGHFREYMGHTWSLAMEEQFYLVWPILLVGLLSFRRAKWAACAGSIAMIAIAMTTRIVTFHARSNVWPRFYYSPITWADSLMIGCALRAGMAAPWFQRNGRRVSAAIVLIFAGLTATKTLPAFYDGAVTGKALVSAALIWTVVTSDGRLGKFAAHPFLTWLGTVSYGAYLWHTPIFYGARAISPEANVLLVAPIGWALTLGMAVASYRYVERPFLRMKQRFDPRKPAGSVGASKVT